MMQIGDSDNPVVDPEIRLKIQQCNHGSTKYLASVPKSKYDKANANIRKNNEM